MQVTASPKDQTARACTLSTGKRDRGNAVAPRNTFRAVLRRAVQNRARMKLSSGPRLSSACVRTTRTVYAPPAVSHKPIVSQKPLGERSGFTVALAAAVVLLDAWGWSGVLPAAAAGRASPPVSDAADRCAVTALDNFADTRAKFSQESSGGNMVEAIVDVRGEYGRPSPKAARRHAATPHNSGHAVLRPALPPCPVTVPQPAIKAATLVVSTCQARCSVL